MFDEIGHLGARCYGEDREPQAREYRLIEQKGISHYPQFCDAQTMATVVMGIHTGRLFYCISQAGFSCKESINLVVLQAGHDTGVCCSCYVLQLQNHVCPVM